MPSWDNSYAERLSDFCVSCDPTAVPEPVLLRLNRDLAEELGWDAEQLPPEVAARVFSGNEVPEGAAPVAQAYAGHQFGGFVPQLGDGRALLLGEVIDRRGVRRDIALKGSGPTPFSRGGDGKAAIGPVLREYLLSEAMHALGIPTTRALAAVGTGERVMRERPLPGAVITRVAASHIRVGTFEFFAARGLREQVRMLADYVIDRHYPELKEADDRHLRLVESVMDRQAALVARWMNVGFIHGVMNTDNTTVSGETIDYGPCAFMEAYDPATVFSSIDSGGRYAYGNQPLIARWNLARFAETIVVALEESEQQQAVARANELIQGFTARYESYWLRGARAKLGLTPGGDEAPPDEDHHEQDRGLLDDWLGHLQQHQVDFTLAWRRLADAAEGNAEGLLELFPTPEAIQPWLDRWRQRVGADPDPAAAIRMRSVNPLYIPRNHLVEEALTAATDDGDLQPFERLLAATADPFREREGLEAYAAPAPREFTSCYKTFCGT